ncbi:hypothetical protein AN958_04425 [Leucoagaricus sp. SymC.cos]|nr:hypothetical protein AN958_04425 [Leucoagaricus sp. SymC.cos]
MQKNNKEIVHILVTEHIDTMRYGLGLTNFKKMQESLGLLCSQKLGHTIHTIRDEMVYIWKWYPTAGALDVKSILFHEHDIDVPKSVIVDYFHTFEPELVAQWKIDCLKCRKFWAAGVNDIWAVDQHNKWKLLGLWLSENLGVANAQTYMRQNLDPTLQETLQHRWMRNKKNIILEISWSLMRYRMTLGFEHELWKGVEDDSYDHYNVLDRLLFQTNYTIKYADKYKILPTGVPLDIFDSPHQYSILNFKVMMLPGVIAEARQLYVNPEHKVFQLVPPDFMHYATRIYSTLGSPAIIRKNIWDIYQ